MKKMNLPNKITIGRIILAIITLIILVFPFDQVNYKFPTYVVFNNIELNLKYIICGSLFAIASLTDFLDGYLARKNNMVTDFGKVMDAIADKILVNGILIILAADRIIPILIPVIVITRDTFVDSIKMAAQSKSGEAVGASMAGKIKTVFMMIGVALVFFNNLPFMLFKLPLGNILLIIAAILSVYSGVEYYMKNKDALKPE